MLKWFLLHELPLRLLGFDLPCCAPSKLGGFCHRACWGRGAGYAAAEGSLLGGWIHMGSWGVLTGS